MNLDQIEFTYKESKMEFKPIKKYASNTNIYSIRFGSINPTKGFINHTDYSVFPLTLNYTGNGRIYFTYNNETYFVAKDSLKNNNIINFTKN